MNTLVRLSVLPVLLATHFMGSQAAAAELPRADPASVGLSADRLQAMDDAINKKIAAGSFPGAITMVIRQGKIAHLSTLGSRTEGGEPMSEDAIFRIYSMTKPIVSVATMMLAEEGKLGLADPVYKYLPEFKDMTVATGKAEDGTIKTVKAKRTMTVQDLLRHTSGLTYGFFGKGPARDAMNAVNIANGKRSNREMAKLLGGLPLEHEPGTTWEYSRSTDVLGALLEVVEGKSLGDILKQKLFDPLGMSDTSFWVADTSKHARLAEALASDQKIGKLPMYDPKVQRPFESGGGGLLSTVHDYGRFAQMLMNDGELDGTRYLSPYTIRYMTTDHLGSRIKPGKYYLPGPAYGFGLGFGVRTETGVSPFIGNAGEYSWGGAAGTYFFADPELDLVFVYMMQSPKHRVPLRSLLRNSIYGAITE
ncbi:MAG: serine hydrolase domain-containing protein [Burkholderiaceae bacterium]